MSGLDVMKGLDMTNYFENLVSATNGNYSDDLPIIAYSILKEAYKKELVSTTCFADYLEDKDEDKCSYALAFSREVIAMLQAYRILTERDVAATKYAIECEMEWVVETFELSEVYFSLPILG